MCLRVLHRALLGTLALPLTFPVAVLPQVSFVEAAGTSGLGDYEVAPEGFGGGLAAADFDDDGFVDLFVPTAAGSPDLLYRNLGNGQFEDVAAARGLAGTGHARVALWLDYNADRRLDLLVLGDCYQGTCDEPSLLRLHRQTAAGTFEEVTAAAGLTDAGHSDAEHRSGMAAGDVNGDGFLDFVTGFWQGRLHLYLNQGDGTFIDISLAAGFDTTARGYHQPVMVDWNDDGLLDIYAAVDFRQNRLFQNQGLTAGMPTFLNVANASDCDNVMNDMGVALGDFDEDGDPDVYVTNIFRNGNHNVLLRNDSIDGTAVCTEVSEDAGVDEGGWGWGTTFFDADNNGLLDLAETNGWRIPANWHSPPRLFINQGTAPATFAEQAATAGLTEAAWGSALLAFDYDRDGDLDLFESRQDGLETGRLQGTLALHQNQLDAGAGDRHYLVVRPRMTGRNHRAIGARVAVEAGGRTMYRWLTAGISYLGQEPAEAFFGLGNATAAERVTISWPGGGETLLTDMPADQVHTVTLDEGPLLIDGFETGDLAAWSAWVP